MQTVEIFPWNESFQTGLTEIDKQHEKLVLLLNELASHMAYDSELISLDGIFDELLQYSIYHFKTEENIWLKYLDDDPLVKGHSEEHRKFIEDIQILKGNISDRPVAAVLDDILSFLTHWLAFHILESDKRLAAIVSSMKSGSYKRRSQKRSQSGDERRYKSCC